MAKVKYVADLGDRKDHNGSTKINKGNKHINKPADTFNKPAAILNNSINNDDSLAGLKKDDKSSENKLHVQAISEADSKDHREGTKGSGNSLESLTTARPKQNLNIDWLGVFEKAETVKDEARTEKTAQFFAKLNEQGAKAMNAVTNFIAWFFGWGIPEESKEEALEALEYIRYHIFPNGYPKLVAFPLAIIHYFSLFRPRKKEIKISENHGDKQDVNTEK